MKKTSLLKALGLVSSLGLAVPSYATIVDIETSQGTIKVNLFDQSTPKTVENFLAYVADDSYIDTILHRSVANFVVQGGGFTFNGNDLDAIETKGSVENEPTWSNVKGTIAMAKVANYPDSATSQWFFNVVDNYAGSNGLDNQNEGFTVFGQVIEGMDVVEQINALTTCSNIMLDIPMVNYSASDCSADLTPGQENFVSIYAITIVDDATNTEETVEKVPTTKAPVVTPTPVEEPSSGGSFSFALLGLLGFARLFRK